MTTPPAEARLQQIIEQWREKANVESKMAEMNTAMNAGAAAVLIRQTRAHQLWECADDLAALLRGRSEPQIHEKTEDTRVDGECLSDGQDLPQSGNGVIR